MRPNRWAARVPVMFLVVLLLWGAAAATQDGPQMPAVSHGQRLKSEAALEFREAQLRLAQIALAKGELQRRWALVEAEEREAAAAMEGLRAKHLKAAGLDAGAWTIDGEQLVYQEKALLEKAKKEAAERESKKP